MRQERRGRPGPSGYKAGRPGESCSWPSQSLRPRSPARAAELSGVASYSSKDVQKMPERSSSRKRIIVRHELSGVSKTYLAVVIEIQAIERQSVVYRVVIMPSLKLL